MIMNINSCSTNYEKDLLIISHNEGQTGFRLSDGIKIVAWESDRPISCSSLLNKTNIMAYVNKDEPNIVIIQNDKDPNEKYENSFADEIRNIILTMTHVIVVLDGSIGLCTFAGKFQDSKATGENSRGLCGIYLKPYGGNRNNDDVCYDEFIIITLGLEKGTIALWNKITGHYREVKCHQGEIEALTVSKSGKYFATASENGTLLKIFEFDTSDLSVAMKKEFRRGTNILSSTGIHDISISANDKYIACTSTNQTAHIYCIDDDVENINKNTKSAFSFVGSIFPYYNSEWACVKHEVPFSGFLYCIFDNYDSLHVISTEGAEHLTISGSSFETTRAVKFIL